MFTIWKFIMTKIQKLFVCIICLGLIPSCVTVQDNITNIIQSFISTLQEQDSVTQEPTLSNVYQEEPPDTSYDFVIPSEETTPSADTGTELAQESADTELSQEEQLKLAETYIGQVLEYFQQGQFQEALPLSEKALKITSEILGEKHPVTLSVLNQLAFIYKNLGHFSEALPLFEKGYRLSKEVLGEKHLSTLARLNNLAVIYRDLGRLSEALPLFERGYHLSKEVLGEKHANTINRLNNLSVIYNDLGRLSAALPLFEKSYRLSKEVLGEKHFLTITIMDNLATIYKDVGHLSEALPLSEKTYRLSKEVLGEKHPNTLISLNNLALIYKDVGRLSAALPLSEKAYHLSKEVLGEKQPDTLKRLNNLAIIYNNLDDLSAALSLSEKSYRLSKEVLGEKHPDTLNSLNNLASVYVKQGQFNKAIQHFEKLVESVESGDLKHQTLFKGWKEAYLTLSGLYISQSHSLSAFGVAEMLKARTAVHEQVREMQIITAKEGTKYLPADTVFISYLVDKNKVLAFTLGNSQLTAHDLGEFSDLEKDLETYRRQLLGVPVKDTLSSVLGKRLLEPLSELIKDFPHWIISPYGPLALIPFETLRFEEPVIAQHEISYVQSLSMLALLQERDQAYKSLNQRSGLLVMGAPIYSDTPGGNPSTVDFNIARSLVESSDDPQRYSRAFRQLDMKWKNLPGSEQELEELERLFQGENARIYKRADATEAQLQNLNQQGVLAKYRYLVFSAHSYFSPQVPALSSIVLGQVNNPEGIDGYVTAGEWLGYNLKSDLMMLSASGDVLGGEGVMSLPYAFYVAGNKNTILTLWSISDDVKIQFISSFFAKLKAGVGQVEALMATKREFIEMGGRYANPAVWAAFVLYGT
jgi:CHAT domain-containing protein/Tfp pilus assembly protein PilF